MKWQTADWQYLWVCVSTWGAIISATHLIMPHYDASLMKAIFSIAFHACECIGEVVSSNGQPQHAILAQNVHCKDGRISVTFTSFTHHRGPMPETRVLQAANGEVYPARPVWAYSSLRPGEWSGPVFIWQSGVQVEAKEVRFHLQQCLEMVEEDPTGLSPHSFRIGSVSEAAGKVASEAQLRMMGCWKSYAYMKYVRPTQYMPS